MSGWQSQKKVNVLFTQPIEVGDSIEPAEKDIQCVKIQDTEQQVQVF